MAVPLSAPVVCIYEFGTPAGFGRCNDWQGFDRERLVRQVLAPLTRGIHELSYESCTDWDSWKIHTAHVVVKRFLILEGVGLFHPDVIPHLDYRIWLEVPLSQATAQGIVREQSLGRDPGDVWQRVWEPNEIDFDRRFHPQESVHCRVRLDLTVP
jgi:hypothetical protein